jgi:hypothetical protein
MPGPADARADSAVTGARGEGAWWRIIAAVVFAALLAAPMHARAQDDGPKVYQLAPLGAKNLTGFAVAKRSNETPESGDVIVGSKIDTDIVVVRYAQTFSLGGQQLNPFIILPVGHVRSTVHSPEGDVVSESSGFGDAQIGGVLGLFGAPALAPAAFAEFRPLISTGLLARVFFPTGAYSADQPVNLGSNRYSFQLGLPIGLIFGQSYLDPALTTLELLPTVTFYDANTRPFGAGRVTKAPQFALESHLTRNFGPSAWVSGDILYRQGGETTTDGQADHNPIRGLSAGLSGALKLAPNASVILTYEQVVARSDQGPDGWFFRTALVVPFR